MSTDVVGICVTIFSSILIGSIAIAIAVFFGLRSTVNPLGDKLSTLKDDLVTELSNIKERIIRIEAVAGSIKQFIDGYILQKEGMGTVTKQLKNFGRTLISAKPATGYTSYRIKVERGRLDEAAIGKLTKVTGFAKKEEELFSGEQVVVSSIGSSILMVEIPSSDPEICTKFISLFLKWLDTEYVEKVNAEIKQFEDNIEI